MKQAKRLKSFLLGASLLAASLPTWAVVDSQGGRAVLQLNLQTPVTQIAEQIYSIHNLMLIICLVIFVAVFGVMFYSILKHRKSLGFKPATFHESTSVEIAWTIVPFLIVIGMALPATKTVVAMKDTSNSDITIKATGMQWKWGSTTSKAKVKVFRFCPLSRHHAHRLGHQAWHQRKHVVITTCSKLITKSLFRLIKRCA